MIYLWYLKRGLTWEIDTRHQKSVKTFLYFFIWFSFLFFSFLRTLYAYFEICHRVVVSDIYLVLRKDAGTEVSRMCAICRCAAVTDWNITCLAVRSGLAQSAGYVFEPCISISILAHAFTILYCWPRVNLLDISSAYLIIHSISGNL